MPESDAEAVVRTFWEHIDARAWDALGVNLDADLVVEYTHTGETLDRSSFVRLNRERSIRQHRLPRRVHRQT